MKKLSFYFWVSAMVAALLFASGFWVAKKITPGEGASVNTSRAAVVKEIQALGNLEATSFTLEKVVDAGTNNKNAFAEFLFGDNLLLIAHGNVVAGFDLRQLSLEQVVVRGKEVAITLGEPKILSATLDSSKTAVYDRKTGFLRKPDKDLETEARAAAEASIRQAACEAGILEQTEKNGKEIVEKMFLLSGFERVIVETKRGSC
jgi:hypothetical protein